MVKTVSKYNKFVRSYAKACKRKSKKFEIQNAAKQWKLTGGSYEYWENLIQNESAYPKIPPRSPPRSPMREESPTIYFEKQVSDHCGMHALNNLFKNCLFPQLRQVSFSLEYLQRLCHYVEEQEKTFDPTSTYTYCRPGGGDFAEPVIERAIEEVGCHIERMYPTYSVSGGTHECASVYECINESLYKYRKNNVPLVGFIFNKPSHWTSAVPTMPWRNILYIDSMSPGPIPLNTTKFSERPIVHGKYGPDPSFKSVWAVIMN